MASKKPSGLGRGLGALLGDDVMKTEAQGALTLPITDVESNSSQPRKYFDDAALAELADSIRQHGIIQPLTVRKLSSGYYQIIAGERRWRAARLAGIETIPAIVREWDDIRRQEAALIENIQRENLNPIEEAQGIFVLMNECALTQEAVAERLGRSRPAVANLLRLLNLPEVMMTAVADGVISAGHGRVLAGIADKRIQAALFEKTVQLGWSVRQLEEAAKNAGTKKPASEKPKYVFPAEYDELTERLRAATGLKVSLSGSEQKGKITLEYASQEELQRLWDMLGE